MIWLWSAWHLLEKFLAKVQLDYSRRFLTITWWSSHQNWSYPHSLKIESNCLISLLEYNSSSSIIIFCIQINPVLPLFSLAFAFKSIQLFHYFLLYSNQSSSSIIIFCIQINPVLPLLSFALKSIQLFHYYLLYSNQSSSSINIFCIQIIPVLALLYFAFKSLQFFHYYLLDPNQCSSSIISYVFKSLQFFY